MPPSTSGTPREPSPSPASGTRSCSGTSPSPTVPGSRSCRTSPSGSLVAPWWPWWGRPGRGRPRCWTCWPGSTRWTPGPSPSTKPTSGSSLSESSGELWASCPRRRSSFTTRSGRTSPTGAPVPRTRKCAGPPRRPTPTTSSRPCPRDTTPSWGRGARSSAGARDSGWPSHGPS